MCNNNDLADIFVLATRDELKIAELSYILNNIGIQTFGLTDMEKNLGLEPGSLHYYDDQATSYEENATRKAQHVAREIHEKIEHMHPERFLRFFVVADDSGLDFKEVFWKHGNEIAKGENSRLEGLPFPGVDTKQFVQAARGSRSASENFKNVIGDNDEMKAVTVLAVVDASHPERPAQIFNGIVNGRIVYSPHGENDFIFEPVDEERIIAVDERIIAVIEGQGRFNHRRKAIDAMVKAFSNQ